MAFVMFFTPLFFAVSASRQNYNPDDFIPKEVAKLRSQLPISLDDFITITNISSEGRNLSYYYSVQASTQKLPKIKAYWQESLFETACMRRYYRSKNNKPVWESHYFTPNDNNAPQILIRFDKQKCPKNKILRPNSMVQLDVAPPAEKIRKEVNYVKNFLPYKTDDDMVLVDIRFEKNIKYLDYSIDENQQELIKLEKTLETNIIKTECTDLNKLLYSGFAVVYKITANDGYSHTTKVEYWDCVPD